MKHLIKDIHKNPQDWKTSKYDFFHIKTRFSFSVRSGYWDFEAEGYHLGWYRKWRMWRAYRWWCVNNNHLIKPE